MFMRCDDIIIPLRCFEKLIMHVSVLKEEVASKSFVFFVLFA